MMGALNSGFNVQAPPATLAAASFGSDYVMEPKRVITASQAAALGLDDTKRQKLLDGEIDIEFLDYDWRLNRTP